MNPQVDKYLIEGCMRCKFGGTPKCKVNTWRMELETLREIALHAGLEEEIKWGVPVYTNKGKNILSISALKQSATLGFFKGALMQDTHNLFIATQNGQAIRTIKFTDIDTIVDLAEVISDYITEAITIEQSGKKIEYKREQEAIPEELLLAFEEDAVLKQAFYSLTPGRQRGYILYFSHAKQSQTRINRIQKFRQHIYNGKGMQDI